MTAVWVVRDKDGRFCYAYPSIIEALDAADFADTVTRETLLTPAHAAVIEAAKQVVDMISDPKPKVWEFDQLFAAVATLRELEGA